MEAIREVSLGAALIFDNIVVFLYYALMRWWRLRRSRLWPKTIGTLVGTSYKAVYPRTTLEYSYLVNGEEYIGTYERGFWYSDSAYEFTKRFHAGMKVAVRYCAEQPSRSCLEEKVLE